MWRSSLLIPSSLAARYWQLYSGFNYRLRSFANGRWASACRPVSILLLITERCNAQCVHCDIWKNRGAEDTPTAGQWKVVLKDLARWLGPVRVSLSGGEALLRAYTPELAAFGRSLGLWVEVLTHGYWIDQRRIEQLAMSQPSRITVSLDAIGETHSRIRGYKDFWKYVSASLETLSRIRTARQLNYAIRLKTVVMEHNIDSLAAVAVFAAANEMEVFYQPIEQNYNTPEDPGWFRKSANWPKDTRKAAQAIEELMELKRRGLPIVNSYKQLGVMVPYFRDPDAMRVSVQSHSAHERRTICGALTTLQIGADGNVLTCCSMPPVGNIRHQPIREIWSRRPHWWEGECCKFRSLSSTERMGS